MNIRQLEHILRAGGSITGSREIVVIGSQALLASFPEAPAELVRSMEVDCYPLDDPAMADLIDGTIGELSPFHETFGYYAHGIGPETAILPSGWRSRVVRLQSENTGGTIGLCVSPADLAVSKLLAGREKDVEFVGGMLRCGVTSEEAIRSLAIELDSERAASLRDKLKICLNRAPH
jgi:hypothetical protein